MPFNIDHTYNVSYQTGAVKENGQPRDSEMFMVRNSLRLS